MNISEREWSDISSSIVETRESQIRSEEQLKSVVANLQDINRRITEGDVRFGMLGERLAIVETTQHAQGRLIHKLDTDARNRITERMQTPLPATLVDTEEDTEEISISRNRKSGVTKFKVSKPSAVLSAVSILIGTLIGFVGFATGDSNKDTKERTTTIKETTSESPTK